MKNQYVDLNEDNIDYKNEIIRYFNFWPFLLILTFLGLSISFVYLRYTTYLFEARAVIEILDESQNSEMALPTELTVFNRSMINLENETNILSSFNLNSKVVRQLKSNVLYYIEGSLKNTQLDAGKLYDDYQLDFKLNTDDIGSSLYFSLDVVNDNLIISEYDSNDNIIYSENFESLTTKNTAHSFPFDISISSDEKIDKSRKIIISTVESIANQFIRKLEVSEIGQDSDQISLKITHENIEIAKKYLNGLLLAFDNDGISDRQLEYKRTIDFVDKREKILKKELELVELRKQNFKVSNNLSDLKLDAGNNIDLKSTYDNELFEAESQKTIANYLLETIEVNEYNYLPINIGLDNFDLNNIIIEYNKIVTQRNRYLSEAGKNNILVKSLQSQLDNLILNISTSIKNYLNSLEITVDNLKTKELEFENVYSKVPENEKTLRSIERELSIKEALYLLLLQKREEAAINLAVVKPTIKVIDYPISTNLPISPNKRLIYLVAIASSISIYFLFLYLWFFFDNKVHNKDKLVKRLNDNIPIIAEIPYLRNKDDISYDSTDSVRSVLSESIRMLISNLKFLSLNDKKDNCKTIIFTSSIKGEGKTLASVNTALSLVNDITNKKVLLIGADLRNPQIHKNFKVEKNQKGLTEILYRNDIKQYKDYIQTFNNLDVLFSGTIPPNPTSLLSSNSFYELLSTAKLDYDYIVIDSAPCILVSDTSHIIDYADSVIYMFRSNFTQIEIIDYINEFYTSKKPSNFAIVFNAVGNSSSYGYKYGYQYGYRYGYKYGYNYGYGYGYGEDS